MITTKGSAKYTGPALRSLLAHTDLAPKDRIVLIDNDGNYKPDNDIDYSKIEILVNTSPRGFAANANQLVDIALAASSDVYLLNNDLIFTPGWIEPLRCENDKITSPLSNREVNYDVPQYLKCQTVMQLEDYLGKEDSLIQLAQAHREVVLD